MKRAIAFLSIAVMTAFIVNACGQTAKEIPIEKMATIVFKMAMDKKLEKDDNPSTLDASVVEPYAKAEGFTAADFKHTAALIEKDAEKNKQLGELVGKMMLDEMMKALGGSDFGKMLEGALDSAGQKK